MLRTPGSRSQLAFCLRICERACQIGKEPRIEEGFHFAETTPKCAVCEQPSGTSGFVPLRSSSKRTAAKRVLRREFQPKRGVGARDGPEANNHYSAEAIL